MTIEFPIRFVGGPHDGVTSRYEGDTEHEDWRERMALMDFDGHTYKLAEWEGDVAVLRW